MVARQIPRGEETFLDHVGLFVSSLEAAGAALEELGFVVSSTNVQQARGPDGSLSPTGTSNRNLILRSGFVELLSPSSPTELSARMEAGIERYEGAHLITFSQSDLERTRARLVADGWQMGEVVKLRSPGSEIGWDVEPPPG